MKTYTMAAIFDKVRSKKLVQQINNFQDVAVKRRCFLFQ